MTRQQHSKKTKRGLYGGPISKVQVTRVRCLILLAVLVFSVIGTRLYWVHLKPDPRLLSMEDSKAHVSSRPISEPRGEIFDSKGLRLATSKRVPSLYADPSSMENAQEVAFKLSAILGKDEDEIMGLLSKRTASGEPMKFVWLKRWMMYLGDDVLEELKARSGGAVDVRYELIRYYPQGDTAAHLLGFVNRVGKAAEGVESAFDEYLSSTPGEIRGRIDNRRQFLESLTLDYTSPEGGDQLQLTIDTSVQHLLEDALDRQMAKVEAPSAMGIVMDPYTGAILALACRPAFDPNFYGDVDAELRRNRAITDIFEPGSAFKLITSSAVLEEGLVTPETLIDTENGSYRIKGRWRPLRDTHKFEEPVSFQKCFAVSSNIAMVKVADQLGPERLERYINAFGFGQSTCPDFRYESSGIFRPLRKWSGTSMTALPMGQEIGVTMPQLARAFAVVANGGYLVEPYFVERALSRAGETSYRHTAAAPVQVLSSKTVNTMREFCKDVVDIGTATRAQMKEYTVGGKTETAQMARTDGPGYDSKRYTAVFAGFAPVMAPRVVCVIVMKEPKLGSHHGGKACAPVFREVVRETLIRMNVPADKAGEEVALPEDDTQFCDADTVNWDVAVAESTTQEPTALNADKEVVAGLPDFSGMTKRQVMARLSEMGLEWSFSGAGRVTNQQPEAGTPLASVTLCRLVFNSNRVVRE